MKTLTRSGWYQKSALFLLFFSFFSSINAQFFTRITDASPLVTESIPNVGASWNDINADGWIDLFICGFASPTQRYNRVYLNNGDGTFTADENSLFVQNGGLGTAFALLADYNHDETTDVFMGNYENATGQMTSNRWYLNNGAPDYSLSEMSVAENPNGRYPSGSWVNFDRDGDLDLFLTSAGGATDLYYQNDGSGGFTLLDTFPFLETRSTILVFDSWIDYDVDGDLDLYIANFGAGTENKLFKNMFVETLNPSYFIETEVPGLTDWASSNIGVNWVDYDNDRLPDLYANVFQGKNRLFHNKGDGTFTEITDQPIVTISGNATGINAWADVDNDGDQDLFLTKGSGTSSIGHLYLNDGFGDFTELNAEEAGELVGNIPSNFQAGDWGDYDNDGDMDLFLVGTASTTAGRPNYLFRNETGAEANWLKVDWQARFGDEDGFGGKISVKATINGVPTWQVRYLHGGLSSFGFQGDTRANFGLGDATFIDTIIVEFPSFLFFCTNFSANQILDFANGSCPEMVSGIEESEVLSGHQILKALSPNPVAKTLTIYLETPELMEITVSISNLSGQQLRMLGKKAISPGGNHINYPVDSLPAGIYYLCIEGPNFKEALKFVKR